MDAKVIALFRALLLETSRCKYEPLGNVVMTLRRIETLALKIAVEAGALSVDEALDFGRVAYDVYHKGAHR